ncbi:MAG: hypothetical protein JSV04_04050 [Candidatus Heimdallarchaeota archaeon]|nr:MAG: hypothetical protein JSV04_04050 [Candidatus Heimdallarchaeota archaeon]
MNRKEKIIGVILLSLFILHLIGSSTGTVFQTLEWKVSTGDSKTYSIDKFFDETDTDGDGDKNTQTITVDGEEVVLKKGTSFKIEIVSLSDTGATIKMIYGDIEGSEEADQSPPSSWVTKTIDNKTYWENWASGNAAYSVDGDNIVVESSMSMAGMTVETTVKRNWKTGWLASMSAKSVQGGTTQMEVEISSGDGAGTIPGFDVFPVFLCIVITTLVTYRKRK